MTIDKLIKETNGRIELFDKKLNALNASIAKNRKENISNDDLLNEMLMSNNMRQMCVQFISDLECVKDCDNER